MATITTFNVFSGKLVNTLKLFSSLMLAQICKSRLSSKIEMMSESMEIIT